MESRKELTQEEEKAHLRNLKKNAATTPKPVAKQPVAKQPTGVADPNTPTGETIPPLGDQ